MIGDALAAERALDNPVAHAEVETRRDALSLHRMHPFQISEIRLQSIQQVGHRHRAKAVFAFRYGHYRHVADEKKVKSRIEQRERAAEPGVDP